jgi:pilus assembly protein CpaB
MRRTTLLSFGVALILALISVLGVRYWLAEQRLQIGAQSQSQVPKQPTNYIVVASASMRFGDRLTADRLERLEWANEKLPAGAFSDIAVLAGSSNETARYVLSSIEKGEPIFSSKITDPGQRAKLSTAIEPGLKAVSIRVNDVLGVAGFVLPGDRVDILLTRTPSNNDADAFVDVLLQGVKVLAIDQTADDRRDQPSVVRTVTFEVTTDEAQKLTLGSTIGTLSLALRNVASLDTDKIERVTLSDMDGGLAASLAALEAEAQRRVEEERVAQELMFQERLRQERQAMEEQRALEEQLRQEQLALEEQLRQEQRVEEQQRIQAQLDRLAALEDALKSMGSEVTGRLDLFGTELQNQITQTPPTAAEPTVVEKEVIVERIVEVPPPPPQVATVGVLRNGQRAEYRVLFGVGTTP